MIVVPEPSPDRQVVVGGEEDLGPVFPNHRGHLAAILERVLDPIVAQIQVHPHVELEDFRGLLGFAIPLLRGAPSHVSAGHVHDPGRVAQVLHLEQEAPGADLGVVGVGSENEHVEFHSGSGSLVLNS